jgi:putative transcriptional regulator
MSISNIVKERLARRIAGEISLSNDPGKTMRKWREIFHVSQVTLAEKLGVSPSVISDYESGRRKSPGAKTVKRFVNILLTIDEENGGQIISAFGRLMGVEIPTDIILDIRDFASPVKMDHFCEAINAQPVACEELLEQDVYGYTIIDGGLAMRELSGEAFTKLFEASVQRTLIFTNISTGRLPLVAIRGSQEKPSLIVLHGVRKIDSMVTELARKERILLAVSFIEDIESLIQKLRKLNPLT